MADFLIEDTYDWLDSPTPLETCQHQLLMSENEIQELTTQLRQERERISSWSKYTARLPRSAKHSGRNWPLPELRQVKQAGEHPISKPKAHGS
ncbi:hypothetical protein [Pseudomonas frederiksbergensis]|uniref:Uncharacterized protein n=1 Tax=Pseudomonas frederiksbergensis TaxID=104087 RepID=A0A423HR89_9PSED|nr:hypothetical protein [Pseudomonas frederiksbergensis]RON15721.1 hypothetical protein BK662_11635 [Pseudomonas frederiksbergensis]